jgi:hypothetical protein
MSTSFFERIGFVIPKYVIKGTVERLGFVHASSETLGYFALQFKGRDAVYRFFARKPALAEALALARPGDDLTLTVKGKPDVQNEIGTLVALGASE